MPIVESICPFCGCGCRLGYVVENNKVVRVEALKTDPVSRGKPCIKGLNCYQALYENRITKPMMRKSKDESLKPCSWEDAYTFIKEKMKNLKAEDVAFTGSGEYSNEDNYILQKFARVVFKTNNVDCCARLCHVATSWALHKVIGITAMPSIMADVLDCDVILILGTNPFSNYPVFFDRILEAKKRGAKIITVGVEPSQTSKFADIDVDIYPEALVAFLGGLIRALAPRAPKKIKETQGFKEMVESVSILTTKHVAGMCEISEEKYQEVIDAVDKAKKLAVLHGMGLTQHINGTQNALASVNLAMLKQGKIIPLRGKVNIQGAGDMGVCPEFKPCGGSSEAAKEIWGVEPPAKPGKKLTEAVLIEPVKALYIMGMNPAHSLPNLNKVHSNLKNMFVVLQHHHPSVTMEFADVVLPSSMMPEKEGTASNAERRVRYVRKVVDPPGKKQDWQILCDLAKIFGYGKQFNYKNASEIFDEIIKVIPEYANLSWSTVTKREDAFAYKDIEFVKFQPIDIYIDSIRPVSKEHPFVLTTARNQFHFCTGEATRNIPSLLKLYPKAFAQIGPQDAEGLKVKDGDVVRISSKVGEIKIPVKINPEIKKPGIVIVPFHFEDALVNKLVPSDNLDTITQTPSYKAIAVNIEKV